jgi:hypothetical protein
MLFGAWSTEAVVIDGAVAPDDLVGQHLVIETDGTLDQLVRGACILDLVIAFFFLVTQELCNDVCGQMFYRLTINDQQPAITSLTFRTERDGQ